MKKEFLLLSILLVVPLFGLHAQNLQSVIKDVKAVVENNVNKVYITGDWGDNVIERASLEYVSGTNNTYELVVKNALINQNSLSFNSVVSNNTGFIFSTEQSDLLTELLLIDTVSEQDGNVVYLITIKITASKPIVAKIASLDKTVMEILVTERIIPPESQNSSVNSFSNTTTNIAPSGRELTFNPDGSPYIIPDEIGTSPRSGLTSNNINRQPVPVVASVRENNQNADGERVIEPDNPNAANNQAGTVIIKNGVKYIIICCDTQGNTIEKELLPESVYNQKSFYSDSRLEDTDQIYIDESYSGVGRVLYENPALMNVMIISDNKRKTEASKLSVILTKEKRTAIQNRLGMSFRVVNVAVSEHKLPKTTTVFYRKKYLKPAIILSDELDGNQKILKMLNPERKIGVDVEIVLAGR